MSSEALRQDIRKTASEKAEKVLAEAKAEADRVLAEADVQAKRITEGRVSDSQRLMEQLEKSEGAKARIECSRNLLAVQSRYADEAFREAESLVNVLPTSDPALYRRVLTGFIKQACAELAAPRLLVVARDEDQGTVEEILQAVGREGGGAQTLYRSTEPLEARGGVVLHTEDRRVYYVNTIESRLLKAREELRARVVETLLGREGTG